jgi:hypothetical protein
MREGVDLFSTSDPIGEDLVSIRDAVIKLRDDYASHNHDGLNSKSPLTLRVETLVGSTFSIGKSPNIFKADANGIYLGNSSYLLAPFRVTPSGFLYVTGMTATGGTIDGSDVFANNFRYKKNTNILLLGNAKVTNGGWLSSISGGGVLTPYGANQVGLSLASASDETSYIQCAGYAVVLNSSTDQAIQWDYNPSLEFWAKPSIATTDPTAVVRMGAVNVDNSSYVGWKFAYDGSYHRVATQWYDGSEHNGNATLHTTGNHHKYRIEVTKTSADHYTIVWKIDDSVFATEYVTTAWATSGTMFGVKVKNNVNDVSASVNIVITQAIFQQNYS